MTQFASKELSEKLQAAGCVSDNAFYWVMQDAGYDAYGDWIDEDWILLNENEFNKSRVTHIPAFTLLDLIGPSEQARANAVKRWGDEPICLICKDRHGVDSFSCETKTTPNMQAWGIKDYQVPMWLFHRIELVRYCFSDAEAWEYVERTGKK